MRTYMWWSLAVLVVHAAGCGGESGPSPKNDAWAPSAPNGPQAGMGGVDPQTPLPNDGQPPAGQDPMAGPAPAGPTPAMTQPGDPSTSPAGPAGPAQPQPDRGEDMPGGDEPAVAFDYAMEQVTLSADLVVASGETLRIGPGTVLTAQANVQVLVRGELVVEGTAEAPVRFAGAGLPRSWRGIVVESGGQATLQHVEIGGATYGLHAKPGSSLHVDGADIDTSFKAAVIESDALLEHVTFHASGDPTFSAVNDVSIDNVNGNLTILAASPTVRDSRFEGSAPLVDVIRVGGDSSPVFERIHVVGGHCGLHTYGGVNSAPRVTDSIFEGMAYGMMAYTAAPVVENSAFLNNAVDVGFCFEATMANRPALNGNYYSAGAPGIDPSCFQIGTTDADPLAAQPAGLGPSGL